MRKIWAVSEKDLKELVGTVSGFSFLALFLLVGTWLYFQDFFLIGQADLGKWWSSLSFLMLLFVPAIGMGAISEEKKGKTWELLLSLPFDEKGLVAGKFLARALFLGLALVLSLGVAVTLWWLGKPDLGVMLGGYLSLFMAGLAYLSVVIFFSSLLSQAAAFLVSFIFILVNSFLTQDLFLLRLPVWARGAAAKLSLGHWQAEMAAGLISLSSLIFFITWISFFLYLAWWQVKSRNS